MSMPKVTLSYAGILILLGVVPYLVSGNKTALIPAGIGVLAGLFGLLALKPALRMHAMHGAATLGLLGILMPAGRLISVYAAGKTPSNLGLFSLSSLGIASGIFLFLCVKSFIAARKARLAAAAEQESA